MPLSVLLYSQPTTLGSPKTSVPAFATHQPSSLHSSAELEELCVLVAGTPLKELAHP
jgi:hypothetical protein